MDPGFVYFLYRFLLALLESLVDLNDAANQQEDSRDQNEGCDCTQAGIIRHQDQAKQDA